MTRRLLWLTLAIALVAGLAVVARPSSPPGSRNRGAEAIQHRHLEPVSVHDPSTSDPVSTTSTTPALAPVFDHVLVVGDSLGIDLGLQLYDQLEGQHLTPTLAAVGDTGLADPAYYDWPAHLGRLLAADHPSLVVVFLGANDDQGLYDNGTAVAPGSTGWDQTYSQEVHAMLAEATAAGATVAWVGMPPMSDPTLDAWMRHIDGIFERQTAQFRHALYVSSSAVLGTTAGGYQLDGPDGTEWRTPDGVHLTSQGAAVLAGAVINAVSRQAAISTRRTGRPSS